MSESIFIHTKSSRTTNNTNVNSAQCFDLGGGKPQNNTQWVLMPGQLGDKPRNTRYVFIPGQGSKQHNNTRCVLTPGGWSLGCSSQHTSHALAQSPYRGDTGGEMRGHILFNLSRSRPPWMFLAFSGVRVCEKLQVLLGGGRTLWLRCYCYRCSP